MTSASDLYSMPRNLVLAASAGTGKTHALVGVVVHLLVGARAGGAVDPARIVATTFSRKAAAEIRARVSLEIDELARAPSSSVYARGLLEALGGRSSERDLARRAAKARSRLPHAKFGTLHSFATGIVQRYALELGLGPRFELATEAATRLCAEDAIAAALEARLGGSSGVLHALTEAAGGIDRLVQSLRRILVQLEEDGRSARELEIDEEDAHRVEAMMRELVLHARAISGHARVEEEAREMGRAWDSGDEGRIERAAAAMTALRASKSMPPELEAFFAFRSTLPGSPNAEKGRRLTRAWRARHRFGEHARFVRDVLADAEARIDEAGRARAELGFGEVLRAARELLRTRPDVADEVGAEIDALLVDEFQDTSRVQRDLLQLLWADPSLRPEAGAIPPLSSVRRTGLLVVGDRKQSIYGFRGADVGVFAELAVGLAGRSAREALGIPAGVAWEPAEPLADFHALRHNRRSVPSILAFANAFSARRFQVGEPPPQLFEIEYVPATEDLLVPPERAPGAEAVGAPRTTWLRVRPKGPTSSRIEEALVITARVRDIVLRGEPKVDGGERAPTYRDIAVLATTNAMLDAVAFALAQADVPYVVSGKGFFRTREVADLAAMLALVLDPSDKVAALEVLRGPWAAVHDETLLGLVSPGRGLVPPSSWSAPPDPRLIREEDLPVLEAIASLVSSLGRAAARLGAGAILREAVRACALEEVLAAMPRGRQRVANVQKLLAMADGHPDARAFHRWVVDAAELELSESEAATFSDADDAVRLLTVHASKGLDFPIVIVPEIGSARDRADRSVARVSIGEAAAPNVLSVRVADEAGLVLEPPSYLRAYDAARRRERAERQRLAYVAVTRASDAMFLVGGRASEAPLDPGVSSLGAVEALGPDVLGVEDVDVPPAPRPTELDPRPGPVVDATERGRVTPSWRVLPVAPTALADFEHCARRFELVHVLGLPEHARGGRGAAADVGEAAPALDARAQGTLAHAVLERLPADAFFGAPDPEEAVSRLLTSAGVPKEHAQHAAIADRALRFLATDYVRTLSERGAAISRELAFVLPIDGGPARSVSLRGSIDLVVEWSDGSVDVVDYKSASEGDTASYALQLDVYFLAAKARFPNARRVRAGLAFLGGSRAEPAWRAVPPEREIRERIATLGDELVQARWREAFPRAPIDRCEAIHCGFIGRCHPRRGEGTEPR